MSRLTWSLSVLVIVSLALASSASAQSYGINRSYFDSAAGQARQKVNQYSARNQVLNRSTVSPYLRLANNSGTSGAYQYHRIRALQDRQRTEQRQTQQLQLLSTQINSLGQQNQQIQSGFTGHPTRFMTYLHYYRMGR